MLKVTEEINYLPKNYGLCVQLTNEIKHESASTR